MTVHRDCYLGLPDPSKSNEFMWKRPRDDLTMDTMVIRGVSAH